MNDKLFSALRFHPQRTNMTVQVEPSKWTKMLGFKSPSCARILFSWSHDWFPRPLTQENDGQGMVLVNLSWPPHPQQPETVSMCELVFHRCGKIHINMIGYSEPSSNVHGHHNHIISHYSILHHWLLTTNWYSFTINGIIYSWWTVSNEPYWSSWTVKFITIKHHCSSLTLITTNQYISINHHQVWSLILLIGEPYEVLTIASDVPSKLVIYWIGSTIAHHYWPLSCSYP